MEDMFGCHIEEGAVEVRDIVKHPTMHSIVNHRKKKELSAPNVNSAKAEKS